MSDALLREWLDVTRAALQAADAEPVSASAAELEALASAALRREQLMTSLREQPDTAPIDPVFANTLRDAERAYMALALRLQDALRERIAELRRVRAAAQGYRPERADPPAFVSVRS